MGRVSHTALPPPRQFPFGSNRRRHSKPKCLRLGPAVPSRRNPEVRGTFGLAFHQHLQEGETQSGGVEDVAGWVLRKTDNLPLDV